jgi:hypothetical protein
MSYYIRKFSGVPPQSQFDSSEGTPLVIDTTTGVLYFFLDGTVQPVQANISPTPGLSFNSDFNGDFG